MIIGACRIDLRAEWADSLKDKRSVVKSVINKTRNKFNVSIAEIENQDLHKDITLGFACVTNEARHAQSIVSNVLAFIEANTDAVVVGVETEIL